LSDDIHKLKQEIEDFTIQKTSCESRINELRNQEDPAAGKFHHEEIFSLQQEKLRLQVEIEFRENKINRLMMEA